MKAIKTSSQTFEFSKEEIRDILLEHLYHLYRKQFISSTDGNYGVSLEEVTKTHIEQGADVHDAHYSDVFSGVKIIITNKEGK